MRVKLRKASRLPEPHGHEVAVLQSSRLMNQAQESRLRDGSFVAVALHATAQGDAFRASMLTVLPCSHALRSRGAEVPGGLRTCFGAGSSPQGFVLSA